MKTKYALLIMMLAVYASAYCSDGDNKDFKRVYIGLSFTPEVSYRYLVNTANGNTGNNAIIASENKQGQPQFGASADFKLGINLTHWLAVESGVGYMFAQYRYQTTNIIGFYRQREAYSYMDIPLGLRFSMGHRKVRGIIAPGVDFDFLVKQKQVATQYDGTGQVVNSTTTIDQTKNFNTFNLSPYLGIGIDCYASPSAVIRIMPIAQIQALKNINQPITEYLWNAGLNVAFLFGL
jgi:hypothetical protein